MKKIITVILVIVLIIIALVVGIEIGNKKTKEENETIVSEAVENGIVNNEINTQQDEEYIFLRNGFEVEKKTGIQLISDMKINDENMQKYNVTYYNYSKQGFEGTTEGNFGEEKSYEGYSYVTNVSKYAASMNYNIVPRTAKEIIRDYEQDEIPNDGIQEIIDNNKENYTKIQIDEIDLDDDGNEEYIVTLGRKYDENQDIPFSMVSLYNNKFEKVADLAIEKGEWNWEELKEYATEGTVEDTAGWISISNIEYFDIDNDGIMEIMILLPSYEGFNISIVKYSEETGIDGETDVIIDNYFEV